MKNYYSVDELVDNPTQRVPICLCLDVSGSMRGEPIKELNKGIRVFFDALNQDEIALYAADVCIVTYGNRGENSVQCISDFSSIESKATLPELTAYGQTPMGEAVNMCLDLLDARKKEYQEKGVDYYQPWLVLMTDGKPYGDKDPTAVSIAQQRTSKMVTDRKLVVFPIGIGADADMSVLAKFSPKNSPLKLNGLDFCQFFQWLSASVSRTSQSLGEKVQLPKIEWSL
jgi:uncharacterized protein YegL